MAGLYEPHRFDIVLLDINMPHLDGFQVMAQMRALERDSYFSIPVVTAQNDSATRLRALKSGAESFISKPLNRNDLNMTGMCNEFI